MSSGHTPSLGQVPYLVISVHPVLRTILIVDMERTLRGIDGQHVVVSANPVSLSILV